MSDTAIQARVPAVRADEGETRFCELGGEAAKRPLGRRHRGGLVADLLLDGAHPRAAPKRMRGSSTE